MNRQSPTFCVMPHMGLAVQNEGDMCVCNINAQSYQIGQSRKTIDQITIDQIWDSPTRKEIADLLDSGVRNPGCQACWQDEDAGVKSSRQELNALYGHLEPAEKQPKIFIVKPGNTCNGACRMCRPETSSSWYRDSYELSKEKTQNISFKDYIKTFESVKNSFNPDSNNLWPVLNTWYEEMAFIDIYGGEPWMITGLWESLKIAIENGSSKNISLRLHTNGSWYSEEYLDILSKFKSVMIGLSIDSHNEVEFEYMRHRLNFKTVMSNASKFMQYAKDSPNVDAYVCTTITPFNIWNLDEITINLEDMLHVPGYKFSIGVTNFVYNPHHYDIRHMPRDIKQMVADKLKGTNAFGPVLQYMNQIIPGCVMYWPKFCMETDKLDQLRGTQFKDVYPEWYNILEPYWDYTKEHTDWYGSCGFSA